MKHNKHTKEAALESDLQNASETLDTNAGIKDQAVSSETKNEQSVSSEVEELRKKLEEISKLSEENFGKFIRMQADFDNYRKRVTKEKEEMHQLSLEKIIKEILPVIDNLERAIMAFRNDDLDSKYVEGIEMVFKQLDSVLERNGLKEIEAAGCEFDPNFHHAVMQVEADGFEENTVVEVMQKGYLLGCKVVRPTLVKVAGGC
jgi:molecular chaperone GrpE